jgi:hypothetical protein
MSSAHVLHKTRHWALMSMATASTVQGLRGPKFSTHPCWRELAWLCEILLEVSSGWPLGAPPALVRVLLCFSIVRVLGFGGSNQHAGTHSCKLSLVGDTGALARPVTAEL